MPAGRPTLYTEDIAAEICSRLSNGESLRRICRDEHMPAEATVRSWAIDPNHPIAAQYTQARQVGFLSMADELLEISDDGSNDWMEREDPDNEGYEANGEHLQRSRLRVDTRKWLLSKMLPKVFGDKLAHVGGDENDPPIQHKVTRIELVAPAVSGKD